LSRCLLASEIGSKFAARAEYFDPASLAGRLVKIEVEVVVIHIIAIEIVTTENGRGLNEDA
jgi:hypothetical protein